MSKVVIFFIDFRKVSNRPCLVYQNVLEITCPANSCLCTHTVRTVLRFGHLDSFMCKWQVMKNNIKFLPKL